MKCIVCRKEYNPYGESHKCDPKLENRIEAGRKAAGNTVERRPSFATRLAYGFRLLNFSNSQEF